MKTDQPQLKSFDGSEFQIGQKVKIVGDRYSNDKDWIGKTGVVKLIIQGKTEDSYKFLIDLGYDQPIAFVSIVRISNKRRINCLLPFRFQDIISV